VAKSQHVIELNGRSYNAATGKPVAAKAASANLRKAATASQGPKLVDGVRAPRRSAALKVGHTPEPAITLMRHAVKKPIVLRADKKAAPAPRPQSPRETTPSKAIISLGTKPEQILHAAVIHKSALISKFGRTRAPLKTDIIPVKPAPMTEQKPSAAAVQKIAAPAQPKDHIAAALEKADSHKQPKLKKTPGYARLARRLHVRPVVLITGSLGLIVLAVGGWLTYNNVPNVAMRIAATRAGVHASIPAYHPAGFSLQQPISYDQGQVSVKFTSNTDNRNFTVVQKASSWDSQTLLENVVGKKQYQSVQSNGRTIYIYDDNDAAWVDGGTFYQIKGDSALSSEQLLKIADSL
jgi:hypothetical protein